MDSGPRDSSMDAVDVSADTKVRDAAMDSRSDATPTDVAGDGRTDATGSDSSSDTPAVDSAPSEAGGACGAMNLGSRTGAPVAMGTTSGTSSYDGTCGGDMSPEAVFEWVAPMAGTYTIDTHGSAYDTVLYVRDGSCTGSELDCNDDGSGAVTSEVSVTVRAGQRIFIFVDGFDGDSGDFEVNITPP